MATRTKVLMANVQSDGSENLLGSQVPMNMLEPATLTRTRSVQRRLVLMRGMQEHQQFWDPPRQTHKIQLFVF